ncbi:hypothetical protein SPBRAN_1664 [uncultured Candidatus Thioglobus sp.]|nr:hypothetical protein SPBRAN_1664 [uncultured Candidatus Thioglobus sp.]
MYFNKVIANHPAGKPYKLKYSDLFYNKGIIMFKQSKYQQALKDFNQAIKIDSKR